MILGKDKFIEMTKGLLKDRQVSQEIVGRNRLRENVKPVDILSAVAAAVNTEKDALTGRGGGKIQQRKWQSMSPWALNRPALGSGKTRAIDLCLGYPPSVVIDGINELS